MPRRMGEGVECAASAASSQRLQTHRAHCPSPATQQACSADSRVAACTAHISRGRGPPCLLAATQTARPAGGPPAPWAHGSRGPATQTGRTGRQASQGRTQAAAAAGAQGSGAEPRRAAGFVQSQPSAPGRPSAANKPPRGAPSACGRPREAGRRPCSLAGSCSAWERVRSQTGHAVPPGGPPAHIRRAGRSAAAAGRRATRSSHPHLDRQARGRGEGRWTVTGLAGRCRRAQGPTPLAKGGRCRNETCCAAWQADAGPPAHLCAAGGITAVGPKPFFFSCCSPCVRLQISAQYSTTRQSSR